MARRKEELTLNYRKLYGTHSVNFCSKSIKKSLDVIRRSHPGSNTLSSLTKKSYLDAYCIKPEVWSNQRLPEGWKNNVHVRSGIFQLSQSMTVFLGRCSHAPPVHCLQRVNNLSCYSSPYMTASKEPIFVHTQ